VDSILSTLPIEDREEIRRALNQITAFAQAQANPAEFLREIAPRSV
jgi:hypothetical protein